jgi:N-acetylglucosaminyldiphosphoundecaprenol N-acetyl-beta-D-mannosaminyltransferase
MPELSLSTPALPGRAPIAILGVPFDNVTTSEAVAAIEKMVASRRPHYLVTANVDFLVQAQADPELRRILANAHLVLCDGTPLLWASRLLGNRLAERVAGADLVPVLLEVAAKKQYRVFFLGATPDSAAEAVFRLRKSYPSLMIAGHYSPPIKALSEMDNEDMKRRICEARPDLLFVAFGCPKAEKWIARHYLELGVPVAAGVGATIDFLAGRVRRAPPWMRRGGLEWLFRLAQEPRRLWRRYATDFWVFGARILVQWALVRTRTKDPLPRAIDGANGHSVLDLSGVQTIDSTGIGCLLVLQKRMRAAGRELVLAAPTAAVQRALAVLRVQADFVIVPDLVAARRLVHQSRPTWAPERAAAP